MNKKKILFIIPEMTMGGAQRSISKLSIEFSIHHTVWLVIFNKVDNVAYQHGGELISLDVIPGGGIFNKIKSFSQRVNRLRKIKKDLGIDVSISFLEGADYINVLSKVKDKIILSIRGSKRHDEMIPGNFFWLRNKILIPWLYRKADAIVTVNYGIANELKTFYQLGDKRIVTIGNFYNVGEILKLTDEPKSENLSRLYLDPVLIATGRLSIEKGLEQLLRVFHQLKKADARLRFVIVGDGPDLDELISKAKQFSLRTHLGSEFDELPDVVFLGSQSNVFKFLKGATLFLMNSSSEGFPNGLVEAMICSVPVVSSNCPYGPGEILSPELDQAKWNGQPFTSRHGVLMPIANTSESIDIWVKTLNELLKDKTLREELSASALKRIRDFDKATIVKQWLEIITEH